MYIENGGRVASEGGCWGSGRVTGSITIHLTEVTVLPVKAANLSKHMDILTIPITEVTGMSICSL